MGGLGSHFSSPSFTQRAHVPPLGGPRTRGQRYPWGNLYHFPPKRNDIYKLIYIYIYMIYMSRDLPRTVSFDWERENTPKVVLFAPVNLTTYCDFKKEYFSALVQPFVLLLLPIY